MNIQNPSDASDSLPKKPRNFIEEQIDKDLASGKNDGRIHTRFPPEPNGYLHIGHAKSIVLNFGIADKYGGLCNLRFDDTNPEKEEVEYIDSIKRDVLWLGYQWHGEARYASDYFDQFYDWAVLLIRKGKAYVCDLTAEEIASRRGTPTEPGQESPYRSRSVEENLNLLDRMRQGEFKDGEKTVRAKIDMASPNMHMRDPMIYRIKHMPHHRTGDKWCIYPMYDFAHGQSDYLERITHSLCTLEFEVHRPLYDWFLDHLIEGPYRPRQIEFARLNLTYTIMSKRKLQQLVEKGVVDGWDDPRMPTISGLRRRGYTPDAIRNFAQNVGIAKRENLIDVAMLEHSVREDLNKKAPRYMAVLDPLKITITNYPKDQEEELETTNNPEDESMGTRKVPFSREIYIERSDFMEDPPRKFFRLAPGKEVRLKSAYIIQCEKVIKDDQGNITALECTYDRDTKSGQATTTRKVKGTLHWVSAKHAFDAEVRLYDRLFQDENPGKNKDDFMESLNDASLIVQKGCKLEPALQHVEAEEKVQFQRTGYFCADLRDSVPGAPVFNQTVPLRDRWGKKAAK